MNSYPQSPSPSLFPPSPFLTAMLNALTYSSVLRMPFPLGPLRMGSMDSMGLYKRNGRRASLSPSPMEVRGPGLPRRRDFSQTHRRNAHPLALA